MITLPRLRLPGGNEPVKPSREFMRKGLQGLYFAPTGLMTNLVNRDMSGVWTAPTTVTVAPWGRYGLGAKLGSASDYGTIPTSATKEYTLLAVVGDADTGGTQALIDDDDGVTRAYQFRLVGGALQAELIAFNTGGSAFTAATASLGAAVEDHGCVVIGRVLGSEVKIWATGRAPGTATVTGTVQTRNSTARVGTRKGSSLPFVGRFHLLAEFGCALPEGDIRRLIDAPQLLFEPVTLPVNGSAVSGFKPAWIPRRARHIGLGVH